MKNKAKTKVINLNIPQAKAFVNMRQKNYWEFPRKLRVFPRKKKKFYFKSFANPF